MRKKYDVPFKLRFDVETISKATKLPFPLYVVELRFDVETISKATIICQ